MSRQIVAVAQLSVAEKFARRAVYRIVRNHQDVDDILQEAYLRLCDYEQPQCPGALLQTFARNIAIDFNRRANTRASVLVPLSQTDMEDESMRVCDAREDPERACMAWEQLQSICEFADTLPPRRREVFVLMEVLGYSDSEVAVKTQQSVAIVDGLIGNVKRRGWRQLVAAYKNDV